ncbi:alpha/beta fold hydrolase [Tabrizicola sp. YIM 78059]|uniref:alpha/beta fold hydrolase n=1 Tax=Tabrizicola sp. YIM 78059 TaxID=2529861 RepID=UPI0010AADCD3|nr:alpha/beta fold hydrolase [Tabrizicola sp. YIM 78059]
MRRLALAAALFANPAAAEVSLFEATAGLELFPCEMSTLSCTTLTLPLDHMANDGARTIDITFALSFASIESRGILFYFVGGPGASGLASAESYLASFDADLTQYMDVVFVDQRGTGPDHGLSCPVAQAIYDAAPVSVRDPEGAMAAARTYVADCTREIGRDDLLPFVSSDQAIRDSEAFRQKIGAPKVWLYGESYGTQFVQAYAAQFPDAVRGVVLDGVVDLNLDARGFYRNYTLAAETILARTLAACDRIAECAEDMRGEMGNTAAEVYDSIAARLAKGPIPVRFVRADGRVEDRRITSGIFEASAFYALYSPRGRADFLRALAAMGRGNPVPLLHLGYASMYVDPETETGIADAGWYSAAFYAITCTDYDSGPGKTPDERADAIMAEAADFAPSAPRLIRSFFMERLACAYWPHQGPSVRPPPFAGGDYPTLVLNSDSDPITPISMARAVLDNARNAYGVFMSGGPHVIWGRGIACPDAIVQDLIIDGILPVAHEQQCEQDLIGDYLPLTLTDPAAMADPVAVAQAVETELYLNSALNNWDGMQPLTVGCDLGGTLSATATYSGTNYAFRECRFWPELTVSGKGVEIATGEDRDGLTLTLSVSGHHSGEIVYLYRTRDEAWSISGTWDGKPATLPRTLP